MLKRLLFPLFAVVLVAAAITTETLRTAPAGAGDAATGATRSVSAKAKKNTLTAKAVSAAKAFKATLSDDQRSAMQFTFGDASKKTSWSNFPTTFVKRNGVRIADMSSAQVTALQQLLRTALSANGYQQEEAIRVADQYLAENGGGASSYGAGLYYVAFYGSPSKTKAWTLQFGGHHLALHITFEGDKVSGTPYFVGVEPTGFTYASKTYAPMSAESSRLAALFASLDSSQLASAQLSQTFDDVLVGPGKDGQFPTREGLAVSQLSASQKSLLTRAVRSYVNDVSGSAAKRLMAKYIKGYGDTKIAWSTSIDPNVQRAYMRIDGPRVWIEIVSQGGVVVRNQVHYHSVWRDRSADYGE